MKIDKEYQKSTSGGVAYALMRWMIETQKAVVFGVAFDTDLNLVYKEANSLEEIESFRGSKYVIADVGDTYKRIKELLLMEKKVLFVGVPCQVAGLYGYLGRDYDNLLTVDLLCHGTPSQQFNKDHIQYLSQKRNLNMDEIHSLQYRKNHSCNLRLLNKDKQCIGEVDEYEDEYVVAFVHGLTYRESCYQCMFANSERIGDITLGDFWGLGLYDIPFEHFTDYGVNLVLVNTYKGEQLWNVIGEIIYYEKRDIVEATKEQVTLLHPTLRPGERDVFLAQYSNVRDFEASVVGAYSKYFSKDFIIAMKKRRAKKYVKNWVKRVIGFENTQKVMKLKHKIKGDYCVGK